MSDPTVRRARAADAPLLLEFVDALADYEKLARPDPGARERRLEWAVLRWNRLAIDFYDRIGGTRMEEWQHYRLDGDSLVALGASAD